MFQKLIVALIVVSASVVTFAQATTSPVNDGPAVTTFQGPVRSDGQPPKQISGGLLNGKALSLPTPVYPAAARADKVSGTVSVQVLIDEEGKIIAASAVNGPASLQAPRLKLRKAQYFHLLN